MFSKLCQQASSSFECHCYFEKDRKMRKLKKWKEKDLGEENKWKPTWGLCFPNYLLAGKRVWQCIFIWVSRYLFLWIGKLGYIHQIIWVLHSPKIYVFLFFSSRYARMSTGKFDKSIARKNIKRKFMSTASIPRRTTFYNLALPCNREKSERFSIRN